MSELSINAQNVIDYIENKSLTESEYNEVVDELIEKDPDFQDVFDRLVDEVSTRIPEMASLRPNSKSMRNIKVNALMFYEFIDKGYDEVKKQMSVQTAEGEWLDIHGLDAGLTRKTLAKATGKVLIGSSIAPYATYTLPELVIVGTTGSVDQESIKFVCLTTPSIDPSTPADADGDFTIEAQIEAEEGGEAGNLDIGMITELFTKVSYFDLVKQKEASTGGFDRESDDDFRARILEKKQEVTQYSKDWFRNETINFDAGVKDATIIEAIYGEGTVGIVVRGTGTVVPQSLIDNLQAHFDSETIKPLANWRAFVSAIATHSIDVTLDVYWKTGFPVQTTDLDTAVQNYFDSLAIGASYVKQMMETQVGLVTNVYNFSTTIPTQDIIDAPDVSTLIVLGTATFNLIEVA